MKESIFLAVCAASALLMGCDEDGKPALPKDSAVPPIDLDAAVVPQRDTGVELDAEIAQDAAQEADASDVDARLIYSTLAGSVHFEDKLFGELGETLNFEVKPAINVLVDLVRAADDEVVATTTTDKNGNYFFAYELDANKKYRVRALTHLGNDQDQFDVVSAEDEAIYALSSEPFSGDLSDFSGDLFAARDQLGGAFNIISVLNLCNTMIARHSPQLPSQLSIVWSRGTEWDCGSCYYNGMGQIVLGGQSDDPDEYDDHIIAHEYGHHVINSLSYDDSPGGSHRNRAVSPTLAYGEGIAYFLAALFLDNPRVVDSFGGASRVVDLENVTIYDSGETTNTEDLIGTSSGALSGKQHEELVGGSIWDTYDALSETEPFDLIALGEDGVWDILLNFIGTSGPSEDVGASGMDLADWFNGVICSAGEAAPDPSDLQSVVDAFNYPWRVSNDTTCGKGKERHVQFVERGGQVVLEARASAQKRVSDMRFAIDWPDGVPTKGAVTSCSTLPCVVGNVGEVDEVIARGATTADIAGYVSKAKRKALQGHYRHVESPHGLLREYRSR